MFESITNALDKASPVTSRATFAPSLNYAKFTLALRVTTQKPRRCAAKLQHDQFAVLIIQ